MESVAEVALDTEADNMFHYRVRVCLMQFLIGEHVFLVDVLAPGVDLKPLWPLLARKHLVMHGSDFDLRLLHDLCGFRARSLFDTMLAAQLLGRQRIGLASLLEDHFGVQLDKNGQKANWSKRPLDPEAARLRLARCLASAGAAGPADPGPGEARPPGLARPAMPGPDRGRLPGLRPGGRERLADRKIRAAARPRAQRPPRGLALARAAGQAARHAALQGLRQRTAHPDRQLPPRTTTPPTRS